MMDPAAQRLSSQYGAISSPVTIVAGEDDEIVDTERQSKALHDAMPGSCLKLFPGVGHMVHYAATAEIAEAIDEIATSRRVSAAA